MTAGTVAVPGESLALFAARAADIGATVVQTEAERLVEVVRDLTPPDVAPGVGLTTELMEIAPELDVLARGGEDYPGIVVGHGLAAIADTGQVGVADRIHRDRLRAFLAFRHVVLVSDRRVIPRLSAAGGLLATWIQSRRYVTFVGGPSRTSDIERILTVGIHGPCQLVLVLVHGWDASVD